MGGKRALLIVLALAALGAGAWFMDLGSLLPPALLSWVPGVKAPVNPSIGERRVSAQRTYVLALKPDQRLYGWGSDRIGQLRDSKIDEFPAPVVVAESASTWRYIAAGDKASYAITADGMLLRRSPDGMRKAKGTDSASDFEALFPQVRWAKVKEMAGMTIGLGDDGRLFAWSEQELSEGKVCAADVNVDCMSLDEDGSLRYKTDAELDASDAEHLAWVEQGLKLRAAEVQQYWQTQPGGVGSPRALQAFAVLEGMNEKERQGNVAMLERRRASTLEARHMKVPLPVSARGDWVDFCMFARSDSPWMFAYAVDRAGALWRHEIDGGVRSFFAEAGIKSRQIPSPAKIQRISCTDVSALALDTDWHLWGFGNNDDYMLSPELGGRPIPEDAMRKLPGRRWAMVAFGGGFTIGLRTDGTLWAWGRHYDSATGGTSLSAKEPTRIGNRNDWAEVDASGQFIVARTSMGELFTWGSNTTGLLGDGLVARQRNSPGPVLELPPSAFKPAVR